MVEGSKHLLHDRFQVHEINQHWVINCYMPTNDNQELSESAYITLNNIILQAEDKQVIVMGDLNAHIEGFGGAVETNANGHRLLELIDFHELNILNNPSSTTMKWNRDVRKRFCVDYTLASTGVKVKEGSW